MRIVSPDAHPSNATFSKADRQLSRRKEAADWIRRLLGEDVPYGDDRSFRARLRDGVILCRLLNIVVPSTIRVGGQAWGGTGGTGASPWRVRRGGGVAAWGTGRGGQEAGLEGMQALVPGVQAPNAPVLCCALDTAAAEEGAYGVPAPSRG